MVDKISRARQKELEQPDPFLEFLQKATGYAKEYQKQLTWVVLGVFVVIVIISGTIYSIKNSEINAANLLAQTLSMYDSKDPGKSFDAVEKQMAELLDEYPNTAAGRTGRVRYAEICYANGKFQKAYDLYIQALDDFKKDPVTRNLICSSLAHTCQVLEQNDKAQDYFEQILDGDIAFLKDEALFNLGLLQIIKGQDKAGQEYFQQLVADHKGSSYLSLAQNRLAQ